MKIGLPEVIGSVKTSSAPIHTPTIPMEDQDSEEYCEATALAEEMMRPSGSHHE
jgi:hypothetical protein